MVALAVHPLQAEQTKALRCQDFEGQYLCVYDKSTDQCLSI